MATLNELTVNAQLGMPLLIQPVQVLDKINGRDGLIQYVVRITTSGEFYNKIKIINPDDLISVVDEEEAVDDSND